MKEKDQIFIHQDLKPLIKYLKVAAGKGTRLPFFGHILSTGYSLVSTDTKRMYIVETTDEDIILPEGIYYIDLKNKYLIQSDNINFPDHKRVMQKYKLQTQYLVQYPVSSIPLIYTDIIIKMSKNWNTKETWTIEYDHLRDYLKNIPSGYFLEVQIPAEPFNPLILVSSQQYNKFRYMAFIMPVLFNYYE